MNKKVSFLMVIAAVLFSFGCSKDIKCDKNVDVNNLPSQQQMSLTDFIYNTGNIVHKKQFPYLVHAKDIFYAKDKYLLIDIRSSENYEKGHIDGAYNVDRKDLMTFLNDSVNPAAYERIAIIDDYGPASAYIATLLRFDGYNAYGLKFGIASWNRKFKSNITKYLSNKYANYLDTVNYPKPQAGEIINTTDDNIVEYVDNKVAELIAEDENNYIIPADEVFANLDNYFIIAYWTEPKYNTEHVKGSIRYAPRLDLDITTYLNTLPKDKKIVVYCNTGHHAVSVVAYLRLLGYDAASMMYGVNSFMNAEFKKFAPGAAITTENVDLLCGDFPLLEGKERTSTKTATVENVAQTPPPAVIPVQNKNSESVGGCE